MEKAGDDYPRDADGMIDQTKIDMAKLSQG